MPRFGYSFIFLLLFIFTGCDDVKYDDAEMAPLTTLSRITMDIVRSDYFGKPLPEVISEDDISFTQKESESACSPREV